MANRKFAELRDVLEVSHLRRMERLEEMSRKAHQSVWWPFTQHSLVAEDAITVIDSRSGENFSVYKVRIMLFNLSVLVRYLLFLGICTEGVPRPKAAVISRFLSTTSRWGSSY